jgi:hypothetical protein
VDGLTSARVESARLSWLDGEGRLERALADRTRAPAYDAVVERISLELRLRTGQTYTLAQLVDVYESSAAWCRDVAQRAAPGAAYAHDLSVVADGVFARAARGASDWRP